MTREQDLVETRRRLGKPRRVVEEPVLSATVDLARRLWRRVDRPCCNLQKEPEYNESGKLSRV